MCMGLDPTLEGEEGRRVTTAFRGGDKLDLELPAIQKQLYHEIVKLGKTDNIYQCQRQLRKPCRAGPRLRRGHSVLLPGAEGGGALADILFGKVSPSGRLPVTFYKSIDDLPPFEDYSMQGRTYRFFDGEPLYPFGYGLSYTTFDEEWLDRDHVEVTNTGKRGSWHTVLRIDKLPQADSTLRPTLTGFTKVYVQAGQTVIAVIDKD